MPVQVTVSRPGLLRGTSAFARSSKATAAFRFVRGLWTSVEPPTSFTVEQWARGEKPRIMFAGEFPGWDQLREIVEGVTR